MSTIPERTNGHAHHSRLLLTCDGSTNLEEKLRDKSRDEGKDLVVTRMPLQNLRETIESDYSIERMVIQMPFGNWDYIYDSTADVLNYARERGIYSVVIIPENNPEATPNRVRALKQKSDLFVVNPPAKGEYYQMIVGRSIPTSEELLGSLRGKPGKIYLIAGPTASGKTAVTDTVISLMHSHGLAAVDAVKNTTRPPREGEKHGHHYYFNGPGRKCFFKYEHADYIYGVPKKYLDVKGNVFLVTNVRIAKRLADEIRKRKPTAQVVPILLYATEETLQHRLTERLASGSADAVETERRIRYAREQIREVLGNHDTYSFYRYILQSEGAITGDFAAKPQAKETSIIGLASRVFEIVVHESRGKYRGNDDAHHAYLSRISQALTGRPIDALQQSTSGIDISLRLDEADVRNYAREKRLHPDNLLRDIRSITGIESAYGVVSLFVSAPTLPDSPHHIVNLIERAVSQRCLTLPNDRGDYYPGFKPQSTFGLVASTNDTLIGDGIIYGLGDPVPRGMGAAPRYLAISFVQSQSGSEPQVRPLTSPEMIELTSQLSRQATSQGKWARGIKS